MRWQAYIYWRSTSEISKGKLIWLNLWENKTSYIQFESHVNVCLGLRILKIFTLENMTKILRRIIFFAMYAASNALTMNLKTFFLIFLIFLNVIVKFADDTTVIGLITDNDETAYREEVSTLTKWCQENHLSLNIDKTKELVVDYRRQSREHTPITIDKTPVERVNSFKFPGVHITEDLIWSAPTDAVLKKAHQRLFFLRRLRKFGTSPRILRSFYTCTVESILTGCITAWFGNSTAGNRRALQRVVQTARHIVGGELPSLQDIYTRRCTRKARRIIKDSSHPSHSLLSLLPLGRRFRSIRSRTSRLRDSFFPQAIRLMNSQKWPTLQHTPTHTTCHALHFNTVQLDYTHTLH